MTNLRANMSQGGFYRAATRFLLTENIIEAIEIQI